MRDAINKIKYGKLLAEVLPGRIETEAENERYLEIIEKMIDKKAEKFSPEENKLFDLLIDLVEKFEEQSYPAGETASPLSTLKFMMEQHDLKQSDLLEIFGSKGIASEVVGGKRSISKAHAKKLAERFNISAEFFI